MESMKRAKRVLRSYSAPPEEPIDLSLLQPRNPNDDESSLSSSSLSVLDDDILDRLIDVSALENYQAENDSSSSSDDTDEPTILCPHSDTPGPHHTCTHPHHSSFSEANLPPILFRLDPPSNLESGTVPPLYEGGDIAIGTTGSPLRDFIFLPRYISVQVPGWLLEYWSRTDPRLTYKDIRARMVGEVDKLPTENTLNMRREREARGPLGLSCWSNGRTQISRAELRRVEKWTPDQICYNTTMNVEYSVPSAHGRYPMPNRLRTRTLLKDDETPPQHFTLDTFLENGRLHVPSPRLTAALNFFYKLAEQALAEDLDSWEELYAKEPAASKHITKTSKKRKSNGRMESKRVRRIRMTRKQSDES